MIGTNTVNKVLKKRGRKKMFAIRESIRRVEQMGKEWAEPGAEACPGVIWEVRDADNAVSYVVEDGVMHHRDRRNLLFSTPVHS